MLTAFRVLAPPALTRLWIKDASPDRSVCPPKRGQPLRPVSAAFAQTREMKKDDTIYTRPLSEAEVQSVLRGLPSFLMRLAGDCIVVAEYGWACNIHNDLQYKPMEVGIAWLDRFISESIEQRIFAPAGSDLSVATPNGGLEILFCHESDIHLSGEDKALVRRACEHELLRNS